MNKIYYKKTYLNHYIDKEKKKKNIQFIHSFIHLDEGRITRFLDELAVLNKRL
jgi:hypothetical protein